MYTSNISRYHKLLDLANHSYSSEEWNAYDWLTFELWMLLNLIQGDI